MNGRLVDMSVGNENYGVNVMSLQLIFLLSVTDLALQGIHHTLTWLCPIWDWFDVMHHGSADV